MVFSLIKKYIISLDDYPINVLKGKAFPTLPGAIFSTIMLVLNLLVILGLLLFYFLQSAKLELTYLSDSSLKPTFDSNLTLINTSIFIYNNTLRDDEKEYISTHYKLTVLNMNNTKLQINIINQTSPLKYQIPLHYINLEDTKVNFPRIALLSCPVVYGFIENSNVEYDEADLELLKDCNNDTVSFINNELIQNSIFIFQFSTWNTELVKQKLSLQQSILNQNLAFKFRANEHDTFQTAEREMGILFDNRPFRSNSQYQFYINWLNPTKTLVKALSPIDDFQLCFSTVSSNEVMIYKVYLVEFLEILNWLGAISIFISCFQIIPIFWISYYLSKTIIEIYRRKQPAYLSKQQDRMMFKWDDLTFLVWLQIKFGCGSRSSMINQELNRMRRELSMHFETLFTEEKTSAKEIEFEVINDISLPNPENKNPDKVEEIEMKEQTVAEMLYGSEALDKEEETKKEDNNTIPQDKKDEEKKEN